MLLLLLLLLLLESVALSVVAVATRDDVADESCISWLTLPVTLPLPLVPKDIKSEYQAQSRQIGRALICLIVGTKGWVK